VAVLTWSLRQKADIKIDLGSRETQQNRVKRRRFILILCGIPGLAFDPDLCVLGALSFPGLRLKA